MKQEAQQKVQHLDFMKDPWISVKKKVLRRFDMNIEKIL